MIALAFLASLLVPALFLPAIVSAARGFIETVMGHTKLPL